MTGRHVTGTCVPGPAGPDTQTTSAPGVEAREIPTVGAGELEAIALSEPGTGSDPGQRAASRLRRCRKPPGQSTVGQRPVICVRREPFLTRENQ